MQYEATVPTVADRIAQTVVRGYLEPCVEPVFHEDSYGYRPGRSAHQALRVCRERCWRADWVLDLDIRSFFDSVPWELVLKAVAHHHRPALGPVVRGAVAECAAAYARTAAWSAGSAEPLKGRRSHRSLVNMFMHVCPHREVKRCRRSFCELCCASDGGLALRVRRAGGEPKPPWCHAGQKPGVGSDHGNGSLSAGQVCDEKTNVVEPLLTHRKTIDSIATGVGAYLRESTLLWARCSQRAACVSLWRCSVLRWRELVVGAGMEEENLCLDTDGQVVGLVALWPREGGPWAAETVWGRVPRGAGADRLVVAVKVL